MTARPHDGLVLRLFVPARWCDCLSARWSHACPGTPPLSAQPAGDTRSGGRSAAGQLGVAVVSTRAHEYDDCSTARRPRRQFARARWCDRSTARWYRACRGTPPLCARPAGDTHSGGRSAAGQLGVAVVSTRAHEYDDCSTTRRPRRQFARARWCDCSTARCFVSRLSGHVSTVRSAGWRYAGSSWGEEVKVSPIHRLYSQRAREPHESQRANWCTIGVLLVYYWCTICVRYPTRPSATCPLSHKAPCRPPTAPTS